MNREAKRWNERQGGDRPAAPARRAPAPGRERTSLRQYLGEAIAELKKVAWPSKAEVRRSTAIVVVAVVVMTSLIFAFDFGAAKLVLFLFD